LRLERFLSSDRARTGTLLRVATIGGILPFARILRQPIFGIAGTVDSVNILGVGGAAEFNNVAVGPFASPRFLFASGAREFNNLTLDQVIARHPQHRTQFAAVLGDANQRFIATRFQRRERRFNRLEVISRLSDGFRDNDRSVQFVGGQFCLNLFAILGLEIHSRAISGPACIRR
jgi:hypothetical protein